MIRKFIIFFVYITIISISLTAETTVNYLNDGGKGNSIAFDDPTITNTTSIDSSGLAGSIKNKLEYNWRNYSAITVVAADKYKDIIKTQKKSTKAAYDETKSIEAGKLIAEQSVMSTDIIIREGPYFEINCRLVDIRTAKVAASFSFKNYQSIDDVFQYAANDIACKVLPYMNVELSSFSKSNLTYRASKTNTTVADAQRDYDSITKSIADIENELSSLEKSGMEAQSAAARKVELEARQKTLQQEQAAAKARLEQRKKDAEQREVEIEQEKSRNESLNNKIRANSISYDKAAQNIKKSYSGKISVNTKLSLIEQKKNMLVSLRKNTYEKISVYDDQIDKDCQEKIDQVEARKYKTTELDSKNKPTSLAKKSREAEKKVISENAETTKTNYNNEQMAILFEADQTLCNEINSDIAELGAPQTASSLNDSDLLRFGNYDGSKEGWSAALALSIANQKATEDTVFVPYKNISGKNADFANSEYNDTVDEYSSYFNRNIPFVYAEITYHLTPAGKPSQYTIITDAYTFYRIDKEAGSNIIFMKNASSKNTIALTPACDVKLSPVTLKEMKKLWEKEKKPLVNKNAPITSKRTEIDSSDYLHTEENNSYTPVDFNSIDFFSNQAWEFYGHLLFGSSEFGIGGGANCLFSKDMFTYGLKMELSVFSDDTASETDTSAAILFGQQIADSNLRNPYWHAGAGVNVPLSDSSPSGFIEAEAGAFIIEQLKGGIALSFNTQKKCRLMLRATYTLE